MTKRKLKQKNKNTQIEQFGDVKTYVGNFLYNAEHAHWDSAGRNLNAAADEITDGINKIPDVIQGVADF